MFSSQRIFSSFVPEDYRPLLACISPAAFKVVDWKKVVADVPTLTRRLNNPEISRPLVDRLANRWPEAIAHTFEKGAKSRALSIESSPHLGNAILELYFAQIFNPEGLFLDLRVKNFYQGDHKKEILWRPGGFWVQWGEGFRKGLTNIYVGYYEEKPKLLRQGLFEVGLVDKKMPEGKVAEVEQMLMSHIGGDFTQQEFRIRHFTKSFETFFEFLLENEIRLSADFLYLGIYLASLYHGMEELGGGYNVQKAFLSAYKKAQAD